MCIRDRCPAVQPVVFVIELFQSFLHGQNVGIGFHPADNDRMLCVGEIFRTAMHCVLRNGIFPPEQFFNPAFPGFYVSRESPQLFVLLECHPNTSR